MSPKKIGGFKANEIAKVELGQTHSAIITTSGELYTFGNGQNGCLGHNEGEKSYVIPKKIEFFSKNKLKVKDVCCGNKSTIALTEDGDVWSWGFGGRKSNWLFNLIFSMDGSLGHGNLNSLQTPHPIEYLRKLPPTLQISAGLNFYFALNANLDLYGWGRGDYGVFGDGNNKTAMLPRKNEIIESMKKDQQLHVKRIKSCNRYTVVQLSDDNLYAWGTNEFGQMGV